jgi:predicted pyridoxine 5'-phosphate oxidase superfamily flavin-nucleotide-binding protein
MTSPSPTRLAISAVPAADDPAAAGIVEGAPVGAIGLEFQTRRRNRVNGRVRLPDSKGFVIEVDQSFGNCPQYIQARRPSELCEAPSATGTPRRAGSLSAGDAELIRRADTFFIASRSRMPGLARSEGLDISHRGGLPGFVLIDDDRDLRFPDYRGNSYFNTLGNLRVDPRCALLFIDFSNGTTLQITGLGHVMTEPEACRPWAGAERAVAIAVDTVVRTERRSRFRFEFVSFAAQFDRLEARANGDRRKPP